MILRVTRALGTLALMAALPGTPLPHPTSPLLPIPPTGAVVTPPGLPSPLGAAPLHPTCTAPATRPGTATTLVQERGDSNGSVPSFQVDVDPQHPCVLYRATSTQDLDRSADTGRTWSPMFHDSAAGATGQAFTASDLQARADGSILLAERSSGDAMVLGRDHGTTWTLADNGLTGQSIGSVDVAPSDPRVMYAATTETGTPYGLYVTRDAGTSWTYEVLPLVPDPFDSQAFSAERNPQVAVDPRNPGHLWVLVHVNSYGSNLGGYGITQQLGYALLESTDYGATWSIPPSLPSMDATQILAVESPARGLLLYLNNFDGVSTGAFSGPYVSANGGPWKPLPVPGLTSAMLIDDPANPDEMLYAGIWMSVTGVYVERYFVTYNSWATNIEGPNITGHSTTGPPSAVSPLKGVLPTTDPTVLGQADDYGNFYLLLTDQCVNGPGRPAAVECVDRAATSPPPYTYNYQRLVRVTPPAPASRAAAGAAPPAPQPAPQLKSCALPLDGTGSAQDQDGALAFDGQALLYTHMYETGALPLQGAVHRLDPRTCTALAPLTVAFTAADLQRVALADGYPDEAVHPYVDTLTYDPNHDALWLSLRTAAAGCAAAACDRGTGAASIFFAPITRVPGRAPTAAATLRFFLPNDANSGEGEDLFAYDFTNDTIWAMQPGGGEGAPGFYNTSATPGEVTTDGTAMPSCWTQASNANIAAWTVTGVHRMYVQSEDDRTLYEVDDTTCATLRQYEHRNFGEPAGEDEQLACDSLTFGSAAAGGGAPTSVVWLRDAINQLVVAYAIPDGVCPYPTTTKYLGAFTTPRGWPTQLCAQLSLRGTGLALDKVPLQFTLAGRGVGTATTDAGGRACVNTTVDLGAGSYPVVARFPGDNRYLASQDAETLAVTAVSSPPQTLNRRGGTPPSRFIAIDVAPPAPPPPAPLTQLQTAEQAQVEAQSQAQAQGHTVAQLQPGLMTQPQRRAQVAVQQQRAGQNQVAYQAVSLRPSSPTPVLAFVAALMAFGFALARRPVALAVARRRAPRGARRPRR